MDQRLSIEEIQGVVEAVIEHFQDNPDTKDEPVPPFETHDRGKLQSALSAPFQSAFGEDIYPSVYDRAAALFYFMAKDHPFENGNKRIAVLTFLYYLAKNGLALGIPARRLYEVAVAIVESSQPKDEIVPRFAMFLKAECIPFDRWLRMVEEGKKKRSV